MAVAVAVVAADMTAVEVVLCMHGERFLLCHRILYGLEGPRKDPTRFRDFVSYTGGRGGGGGGGYGRDDRGGGGGGYGRDDDRGGGGGDTDQELTAIYR